MDSAAEALLIIVSATLSVFLIVAIVLFIMVIKLVKKVKIVADQAERAVESVATAGEALRKASGPVSAVKAITTLFNQFRKS